ncbi:MAG: ABC transporter ATP-binding protein [Acidimicrobiales bacterium]
MIEINKVSKTFNSKTGRRAQPGVTALHDVSLTIEDNEFVTLIGPSGCGKTTLLRAVAGLTAVDEGEVKVDGAVVSGPSPQRAMVFQAFALMPWANVLRNVAFGLELRGTPKKEREEVARDLIKTVGLAGFEKRLPAELSGGMRQRVGLARALAVNPSVLLMDEPFGALDEQTKRLMQEELLRIWELERKTVIFVTHSIDEAILLADRCVLMSARPGQIAEVTSIKLDRPRTMSDETSAEFVNTKAHLWDRLRSLQIHDEHEAVDA